MQNNAPKISVIMPVYNGEKFLKEAIESILNQTFQNFELIIINDGSKDSSLDIIKKYENSDNRIKVINQENAGVSVSRNNGIKNSIGEYVAFIDCDDLWLPKKLETQLESFNKDEDLKICGTWGIIIDANNNDIRKLNYPPIKDG